MNGLLDITLLALMVAAITRGSYPWRVFALTMIVISGLSSVYDIIFLAEWTDWTYVATATGWIILGVIAAFMLRTERQRHREQS